jgi:Arc-like DNA binding domain
MARKQKTSPRWSRRAQLKIRLPESVRLNLERAARRADRSMNAEAVWRLTESVSGDKDPYAIAAEAILNGLDEQIVTKIEDMILTANFSDEQLERMWREKWRKAGLPTMPDEQQSEGADSLKPMPPETDETAERRDARTEWLRMFHSKHYAKTAEDRRSAIAIAFDKAAAMRKEADELDREALARLRELPVSDQEPELPIPQPAVDKSN